MKSLKAQVAGQVLDDTYVQIKNQVDLWVWGKVSRQVGGKVRPQIWEQLKRQIWDQIDESSQL